MFHYVNAITNTKGDALIGYFVKVVDPSTNEVVSMYADESSTPIESVSGVENACEVNADGNASFYVDDGEYHLDIYATDAATFVRRIEDIPMAKTGMLIAATIADLADLDTAYPAILTLSGSQGIFVFDNTDLSIQVAADPDQTTYVAPSSDITGASGAWFRVTSGTVQQQPDTVQSGVVSGCGIAYRELLIFDMSAGTYYLDGILHTAAQQEITLAAADGTNPRIDVLYLDTAGVLQKLTGTPAASPSKPSVDPTTQLELTFVLVPAAAASLSGVTTTDIYLENTEWTTSQSGSSLTLASTNNPYAGTKCIETTGTFGTGEYVNFATTNRAFAGDGNLILRIRSKTTWNAKRNLLAQFWCDGAIVGSAAAIRSGAYGFDSSSTSSYQVVIIPKSVFAIAAGTEIDALRITCGGSGNSVPSFYMDNIQLQTNGTAIGNSDLTQSIADSRYVNVTGDTMTGDLVVPDEAYDATAWNGSLEVPTKNAIRDKLESIAPGGVVTGALLIASNLSDVASVTTSRTNLGLGTGDSPQFAAVNIGNASDTTISRVSAGVIAVEGVNLLTTATGQPLDAELTAIAGLTSAADRLPYFTGSGTASLATFTAAGRALVDDADASAQRTTLGLGTIATFNEGTTAEYRANTSGKALSTDKVWGAADYVALTDAATVAVDMSTGINFSLTIGGNRTLGAPSNMKAGQTGAIVITQDGTGSRTLAYNAAWLFAGGTDPVLSTAAGTKDVLFYQVLPGATTVIGNLVKAIA